MPITASVIMASTSSGGWTPPDAPGPVTIVSAVPVYTPLGIAIEVTYQPPSPLNDFAGVHVFVEVPARTGQEAIAGQMIAGQIRAHPDVPLIDRGRFNYDGGASVRLRLDYIEAPQEAQQWRVYLVSYSALVEPDLTPYGQPSPTPNVVIDVAPPATFAKYEEYAPNPTNPTVAQVEREWRNAQWYWRVTITWTDPTYEQNKARFDRFAGVDVVLEFPFADVTGNHARWRVAAGVQRWTSDWMLVPDQTMTWTAWLVGVDIDGQSNSVPEKYVSGVPYVTPYVCWTVSAPDAVAPVTNVSGYLWQGQNEDGVSVYGFGGDFTEPEDDPSYAGCTIYARYQRPDGSWFTSAGLAVIARGGVTEWKTEGWPLTEYHDWELRYCSYDANNHETPIDQAPRYPTDPSQWLTSSPTSGGLKADRITGKIKSTQIEDGAITRDKILDGAIDSLKLAAAAVSTEKLAALAVDATKLAPSSVTSTKIANAAVGAAAIAALVVGEGHIANGAITSAKIGTAQILSAHIGNAQILNAHIGNAQIDDAKIANLSANKINTGSLNVGGPGMVGEIIVRDGSSQQIGWIGTEGGYSGGWLKNLWVGGSGPSDAPLYTNSAGKVTLKVANSSIQVQLDPNDSYPFRVFEPSSPANEARITTTGVYVGGYYGLNPPGVSMTRSSSAANTLVFGGAFKVARLSVDESSNYAESYVGISDLARYVQIYIDRYSTSELRLANTSLVVDGYAGLTTTVDYAKPGGGSGTMTFRRGVLTGVT